ncbi:hypothetical protein [Bacillus rubiinfantis]|uniref:hypothetical protein n=1 Tax=Bacillus rubiinfantis TaxID=1499680 RepID=UPI0005A8E851|nr:hypothetical protein [Bacillus rubiinfantis]
MNLTQHSRLSLITLQIYQDMKHYIVEDCVSGEFFEMPQICVEAIELLRAGETLGAVEERLKQKYPAEEVDLLDFAQQLIDLQLVATIDGENIARVTKTSTPKGYQWIPPKLGKFFFNPTAYFVYVGLFIGNFVLFYFQPSLFPTYKDLFIFDYMFLNILAWMLLSVITVLIHEFGHVLAMRAYQLPTKLEIGHRLFLVVFETDMSAIWKLPAKNRNVLYLAGLCFDTVILFFALIGQLLFSGNSNIVVGLLNIIVLDTFIRMVYQCCIYMKTDLYHVFENTSGCYNLMENAQQLLNKWLPLRRRTAQGEVTYAEERRIVFVYSIFYLTGMTLTVLLFAAYYIPQLFFAVKKVAPGFSQGVASVPFWDAVLFTSQIFIIIVLLLYSWRKKYFMKQV